MRARSVSIKAWRYHFEAAFTPSIFWVDLEKFKLAKGDKTSKLNLKGTPILAREVSGKFAPCGVLKYKADGKGGQTIENTGPLNK